MYRVVFIILRSIRSHKKDSDRNSVCPKYTFTIILLFFKSYQKIKNNTHVKYSTILNIFKYKYKVLVYMRISTHIKLVCFFFITRLETNNSLFSLNYCFISQFCS